MVLFIIGLGLGDAGDITVKGLEALRSCSHAYLEEYTAILPGLTREALAASYGVADIREADRDFVEQGCEEMLEQAHTENVAFLVVGDALCATTHTDLFLRAKQRGVQVRVFHNASIMNAIASCGLQLYRFGETVSVCFWLDGWRPDSYYEKILANRNHGLHTLCLLDIKVKEQSIENLMRGRKIFEPPRFMTVNQALEQLQQIEDEKQQGVLTSETKVVGVARIGREDQRIAFGTAEEVASVDFEGPLHSLVVCAPELHEMEVEFLEQYKVVAAAAAHSDA
jgi:diphthine synthase